MEEKHDYHINLDIKYGFLTPMDIPGLISECREKWYNQTLCQVNDCCVRLGVFQGEFHWHQHEKEDEFFLVLDGSLLIDIERETVTLGPHQGYAVPRGTLHRTMAPEKTTVIMVEASSVKPAGD